MALVYATVADLAAYVPGWVTDNARDTALIEAAQFDIDSLFLYRTQLANGLRYDLNDLTDLEITALRRATCAQAQYRYLMGPDFFVMPRYAKVSGPEFTTEGAAPYIGPLATRELMQGALAVTSRSTMARGGP